MDLKLSLFGPFIKLAAALLLPLSGAANPVMKSLLPVLEPVYLRLQKLDYKFEPLSQRFISAILNSDPRDFDA